MSATYLKTAQHIETFIFDGSHGHHTAPCTYQEASDIYAALASLEKASGVPLILRFEEEV